VDESFIEIEDESVSMGRGGHHRLGLSGHQLDFSGGGQISSGW
jgi:hypothetical protein